MPASDPFRFNPSHLKAYKAFLKANGFIHFKGFFDSERMLEVSHQFTQAFESAEKGLKNRAKTPYLVTGQESNNEVQRIPFLTTHAPFFHTFILEEVMSAIRPLGFEKYRVGFDERNGVVATKFNNKKDGWSKIGWHTDIGNSLYYVQHREHYFNVGLHLDQSDETNGCLHVLPGTQRQSAFMLYTKKAAFLDNRKDPHESSIETEPGDLTIHDGRLWHRVSPVTKQRRVLYFNLLKGKKLEAKTADSSPTYMKIFMPIKRLLKL